MQFNSYNYIFFFLPIIIILYFAANRIRFTFGKLVLIAGGLLFYSLGRTEMLIVLGISIVINYCSAVLIHKKKIENKFIIAIPVIVNTGLLIYFKYTNFILGNINSVLGKEFTPLEIMLPLGISFYTFQQIAYIIAVSRKELEYPALLDYLSYILYFPKMVMGPLMEPADFISQINDSRKKRIRIENIVCGIKIFSYGLAKKVLLADTFAKAVSWTYTHLEAATAVDCILLVLFYTFEIYFDFSGYSDMAVGASTMLNIDLPINFDSPYKAVSIRDFWKRWHISLTKFFTKYIYIPLGGSRRGKLFTCINTMIVFLISGIWHGANWTFILWGVLHGILCCADRISDKFEKKILLPVRWACTFILVNVLWLLFSAESVEQWKAILHRILLMKNTAVSDGIINAFKIPESQFIYNVLHLNYLSGKVRGLNMIVFILAALFVCFVPENNYRNKDRTGVFSSILAAVLFVWGVFCLGAESVFVYYGF